MSCITTIYGLGIEDDFRNALYTLDVGQNDLTLAFGSLSYSQVIQRIPCFISEIRDAMWVRSLLISIDLLYICRTLNAIASRQVLACELIGLYIYRLYTDLAGGISGCITRGHRGVYLENLP